MRLQRQLFGSRVARRVFAFFLVASLVPLLGFAALALTRVGAALEQQAFQQLDNASRSYGQITFDKLIGAADSLKDRHAIEGAAFENLPGLDAAAVTVEGTARTLFGEWQPASLPSPAQRPFSPGPVPRFGLPSA